MSQTLGYIFQTLKRVFQTLELKFVAKVILFS